MKNLHSQKWIPTFIVMATIFYFSSQPSSDLPNYGFWDTLIKKTGHVIGYLLLSLSMNYWFEGKWGKSAFWSILYAVSDEFHQSFTDGRHPSLVDVLVFDLIGIVIGIGFYGWLTKVIQTRVQIPRH